MNKFLKIVGFVLVMYACDSTTSTDVANEQMENNTPYQLLALGDSYTIGESVEISQRWPIQLMAQLRDSGTDIDTPRIIARTGWTTDELMTAIEQQNPDSNAYDLVSLLIGVNNQYRGYDIEQYETEFEELLQRAIAFSQEGERGVFVISIPDYGVTPFAASRDPEKIAMELDQYNQINQAITNRYGIQYFYITDFSRQAKNDPSLIASDGLHPSGRMYSQWVAQILPWAKRRLESQ
jgi:lysophospholipase L1-like esterase